MSHQNIIFSNISKENLFSFEKNIFLKISTLIQIIISIKVAMVLLSRGLKIVSTWNCFLNCEHGGLHEMDHICVMYTMSGVTIMSVI